MLNFLITKGFSGTAGHVDTILGRIGLRVKARNLQEKANHTNEVN